MKQSFYVYLASLFIIMPIRIWEYKNIIDPVTGFYNEMNMSTFVMMGVLLIGMILIVFFVGKGGILGTPFQKGANVLGINYIIVGIVIEAIYLLNLLPLLREKTKITGTKGIITVIGLVAGMVFVIIGMKFLLHKIQDTLMRFLLLIPILWSISMLWRTFMNHQTIKAVSEHLFDIVSYILVTLGFLYVSYTVSGFGAIQHQKHMVISGLLGSLLCLTNAACKIYSEIFVQKNSGQPYMELSYILDLSVGILLMVSCIYICFGVDSNQQRIKDRIASENIF